MKRFTLFVCLMCVLPQLSFKAQADDLYFKGEKYFFKISPTNFPKRMEDYEYIFGIGDNDDSKYFLPLHEQPIKYTAIREKAEAAVENGECSLTWKLLNEFDYIVGGSAIAQVPLVDFATSFFCVLEKVSPESKTKISDAQKVLGLKH